MKQTQVTIDIEQEAYQQMLQALGRFGDYEIGGMLIGYKKEKNRFAISSITVADDSGNFKIASFIREPAKSVKMLLNSFKRRNHSYLGEWHSHPHFSLYPSKADIETVRGILLDPGYAVDFALLLITKLKNGRVDMAGFLFHKKISHFMEASISSDIIDKDHVDMKV